MFHLGFSAHAKAVVMKIPTTRAAGLARPRESDSADDAAEDTSDAAADMHGRRLRNTLILGNVVAWLILFFAIKWMFF
jgi:hypothetical protein